MIPLVLVAAALAAEPDASAPDVAPPPIVLDASEQQAVARGETIWRHEGWRGVDGGVAATLVEAPADVVWRHVLDYDAYVEFLPYVTASRTESTTPAGDHTVVDCTMELTTKGIVTRYAVRNWFYPEQAYLAFVMTAGAVNPLRQATGYWRVAPWEEDPSRTLLAYRIDAETSWIVPGWAKRRAAERGLPTVAALVAERAETEAKR